ncbi:MAG: GatB/YqeY domain-containing protein [Nitrosomonas sp.]|nr:GatB/YqeY domain-containing protein [Nitrosomonas sp.]
MVMDLKQKIADDMKAAMRSGDTKRRDAIRLLQAAIKQREVDERIVLDNVAIMTVIEKMLKQRKDSITQYEVAKRQDLADAEKFEIEVLQAYMPQPLSESEIIQIINEIITSVGQLDQQSMGKIMAALKPRLAGRADMSYVSGLIKEKIKALT